MTQVLDEQHFRLSLQLARHCKPYWTEVQLLSSWGYTFPEKSSIPTPSIYHWAMPRRLQLPKTPITSSYLKKIHPICNLHRVPSSKMTPHVLWELLNAKLRKYDGRILFGCFRRIRACRRSPQQLWKRNCCRAADYQTSGEYGYNTLTVKSGGQGPLAPAQPAVSDRWETMRDRLVALALVSAISTVKTSTG